ncbi:MAG: MFS transporter [Promethearchaeota archaeon]|nr:MAG: MFS transporter [Candidatus Lokiarchaeota archaeon]
MVKVPRELHGRRLFGYTLGNFGMILTNMFIGVFIFQYYVYTINLDSVLTSVGISLQLIISAIFSIVFGIIADNKKPGRFGKRRPFLFYGLPIWVFTSIIIWLPPKCPQNNSLYLPTAVFLWSILIIKSIAGSSIMTVHLSMLTEQSQTHENREKIAAVTTFFHIIASILALMLPLIVESILPEPENVKWWEHSGEIIIFYMPWIGTGFTIFALFTIIITFFSVDESFHKSPTLEIRQKRASLRTFYHQMKTPLQDKKYRKHLVVRFFNSISGRILGVIVIPFLTYSLIFTGSKFYIYIIVSILSKILGFSIWRKLLKKNSILKIYKVCIIVSIIASFLELLFLIEFLSIEFELLLFIVTIGTILGSMYGLGLFDPPLASVLVYEAADKVEDTDFDVAVSNISGAYFGLSSFIMAAGQSLASLMIGLILTGSNAENSTIITITLSSMGIFYLLSLFFLKKIKLEKKFISKPVISHEISEEDIFLEK